MNNNNNTLYECDNCNYNTSNKIQYIIHISTITHRENRLAWLINNNEHGEENKEITLLNEQINHDNHNLKLNKINLLLHYFIKKTLKNKHYLKHTIRKIKNTLIQFYIYKYYHNDEQHKLYNFNYDDYHYNNYTDYNTVNTENYTDNYTVIDNNQNKNYTDNNKFLCVICNKKYKYKNGLNKHIQNKH